MAKATKKKEVKLNLKGYDFPDSSNISKLEYDKEKEIMITTFTNGKRYQYDKVPKDIFRQLRKSESIGSAHHKLIIASGFEGIKLE